MGGVNLNCRWPVDPLFTQDLGVGVVQSLCWELQGVPHEGHVVETRCYVVSKHCARSLAAPSAEACPCPTADRAPAGTRLPVQGHRRAHSRGRACRNHTERLPSGAAVLGTGITVCQGVKQTARAPGVVTVGGLSSCHEDCVAGGEGKQGPGI